MIRLHFKNAHVSQALIGVAAVAAARIHATSLVAMLLVILLVTILLIFLALLVLLELVLYHVGPNSTGRCSTQTSQETTTGLVSSPSRRTTSDKRGPKTAISVRSARSAGSAGSGLSGIGLSATLVLLRGVGRGASLIVTGRGSSVALLMGRRGRVVGLLRRGRAIAGLGSMGGVVRLGRALVVALAWRRCSVGRTLAVRRVGLRRR